MKQYLKKFFYILAGKKSSLILLMFLILSTSVLEAVGIGLIGPFIALANDPNLIEQKFWLKQTYDLLGVEPKSHFISLVGIVIIVVFYFKSFLNFRIRRHIFKFSLEHQGDLRVRLLKTYLAVPYTFHLKSNTAFLIQNIISETASFCNGILLQILNSAVSIFMILTLSVLLVSTDALATLVIVLTLLTTFVTYYRFKKDISDWGSEVSNAQSQMIRIVNHGMGGLKETRVIGCESYFTDQLKKQVGRYASAASSFMTFNLLPRIIVEAIIITFIVGLTSVTLIFGRSTQSLISTLGVFAIVSIRLIPAVTQLTSGLAKIRNSDHTLDILYHDLRKLESLKESETLTSIRGVKPESESRSQCMNFNEKIVLDRIYYRYPEASETALKGVSLTIEKGQSIALIGKSGAGKTTLVDVILGLLTPESGDIKVDGLSIYQDVRSWQNLIGYIPQSIFLTDDTIGRNIAFGVPDSLIDLEKLNQVIEAAQLSELIQQLPEGMATQVGERGVCLSGGQRQRIGIARALYHGSEILVLDEATSALDNETEFLVTESIKSLSGVKTIIVIAHRLTTVAHCDRIYQMEKGRIVKSGSYSEVVEGEEAAVPLEL